MGRYSLQEFIGATQQEDKGEGIFELETPRLLEINLDGLAWMKMGAMVCYQGNVKFTREGMLDQGLGNLLKKAISSDGASLTKAEGQGKLYLADNGKKVSVIALEGEAIYVNGNDVLAFESCINYKVKLMKKIAAVASGGLFNVRLEGQGLIAITSHYEPRTLLVEPGKPVFTDPNATVAWSGNLEPTIRADVSFKTFLGRGSGDSIQMCFEGEGFVVVQPCEEVYYSGKS